MKIVIFASFFSQEIYNLYNLCEKVIVKGPTEIIVKKIHFDKVFIFYPRRNNITNGFNMIVETFWLC